MPYPGHRISGFQRLGDTLGLRHRPDDGIQPLLVNICQVAVQLAAQLQAGAKGLAVLPDVPQVHRPIGRSSSSGKDRQGK